jgi:hypothetical protein
MKRRSDGETKRLREEELKNDDAMKRKCEKPILMHPSELSALSLNLNQNSGEKVSSK